MQQLILTPNTMVYAVASFTSLTLGSFFVCSHIYERWLKKCSVSLMAINAWVKGLIVLLGLTIVSPESLFSGSIMAQSCEMLLGCCLGYLFLKFEMLVIKLLPYQARFSTPTNIPTGGNAQSSVHNIKNILNKTKQQPLLTKKPDAYTTTAIVGIFEEILYRGFLTLLCFHLPNLTATILGLFLVNSLFAASHINLGYCHVLTKWVLGFIGLASFLCFKSLCTAMAMHASFNLLAIRKLRALQHA